MKHDHPLILSLNGGSSSIRFSLYSLETTLIPQMHGKIDRIGLHKPVFHYVDTQGIGHDLPCDSISNFSTAVEVLVQLFETQNCMDNLSGVGHRLVHGMLHNEPEIVTPELINTLHGLVAVDPDHLPLALELIEAITLRFPKTAQVVCFDTTFHRDMPRVAKLLPIPKQYEALGIQRYGFHGLSYAFLMEELAARTSNDQANGRVVLAHLGNGASMAAVQSGQCIDTSMGFTPASGLAMGTRSGDLDPGLALYLKTSLKMTTEQFDHMVNHESGLLGLSGISPNMLDLLALEATDPNASDAVTLFCYQAKKCIGAYAAALGGLDCLVFSGGIGENGAAVRTRICEGLGFLGIKLDDARNAGHAELISSDTSQVAVYVIRTDEEVMIARSVCHVLGYSHAASKY